MALFLQVTTARSILFFRRFFAVVMFFVAIQAVAKSDEKHAELKVSGYGIMGDIELKRTLNLLETTGKRPEFYDANFIEDSVLVLFSRLHRDGYLRPGITAKVDFEDGSRQTFHWDSPIAEPLPRPLKAGKVQFTIEKGVLYHFQTIRFQGLQSLSLKKAKSFFEETGALLPLKRYHVYSTNRVDTGLYSLVEALNRQGYESAKAEIASIERDDRTGLVNLSVKIVEGIKSVVRSVKVETFLDRNDKADEISTRWPNQPYSDFWLQDFTQSLKTNQFKHGYPDTRVNISTLGRDATNSLIQIDLLAQVKTGHQIKVHEVKFEGEKKTKAFVLENRVPLKEGDLLDRMRAEQGRYRLARLGTFESVELSYERVDEDSRNVVYQVREGKEVDVSMLFGYGSYELLRGGFQVDQYNVFGLGHQARTRLIQSFKSSSGDYLYTIPDLLGEDVDFFFNASALRREEVSFTRREFGGGAGVRHYFRNIWTDVSMRYSYQVLNAADNDIDVPTPIESAGVGSIITDIRHDRRDNPLYPHSGYKVFSTVEFASTYLGGDVDYQRLELFGSYHQPLDEGRWLHFGLSHGVVFTGGDPDLDLPFNKRFFPGGENSIRGYQDGEAAPRNSNGDIVGAETYLGGGIQFEQALTPSWSAVVFIDGMTSAQHIEDYPGKDFLLSVGGGINWRTVVGPVRLEYGYNLNPRPHDPMGTLHFSIGFPF